MTSINKTNASLTVKVDEPVHLYYMIGYLIYSLLNYISLGRDKISRFQ